MTQSTKRWRHLQVQYAGTAQAFSDYLRLIFLTGGREAETIAQQWPNVDWERKVIHFPGKRRRPEVESPQTREISPSTTSWRST
jgi:integrase